MDPFTVGLAIATAIGAGLTALSSSGGDSSENNNTYTEETTTPGPDYGTED